MRSVPNDRIPWHSGLLLILLSCSSVSAYLSLLSDPGGSSDDVVLPNGSVVPYSESLSISCPPSHDWLINGSKQLESRDSSLSFSAPPKAPLRLECLSRDRGVTSYAFIYVSVSEDPSEDPSVIPTPRKHLITSNFQATTSLPFKGNLRLECSSSDEQASSVVWLQNAVEIAHDGESGSLHLFNVTHSSTFGCLFKAPDGSPFAYLETLILVPPVITHPPERSRVYLRSGSPYSQHCEANTYSVQWSTNEDDLMEEGTDDKLSFESVTDDLLLTCTAENELGKATAYVQVLVVEPTQGSEKQLFFQMDELPKNLTCDLAEVDPRIDASELNYTWYVNGSLAQRGSSFYTVDAAARSGNYSCLLETPIDAVKVEYSILFSTPPIISDLPSSLEVLKREPFAQVECKAVGDPLPSVHWTWIPGGQEEIQMSDSALLIINSSLAIDSTTFKCVAESPHGITEQNMTLKVFQPTKIGNDSTIRVNASEQVTLSCGSFVDARLEYSVSWLKDGEELKHLLTPENKVFIPYVHRDHGGKYICRTETPLESVSTVQTLVINLETPSVELPRRVQRVTEGSSLQLSCNASGIPSPSVHWKKDEGNAKVSDDKVLTLEHIDIRDGGSYSCLAVNEYGSQQESLTIEVYNKTRVSLEKETLISETNDLVILECPVQLDKRLNIVSITWYKDGLSESISQEPQLVITNATKKDQGTYICHVETPVDRVNQTLRLGVLSEGPSFLSTEEDVRTLEGSNITVTCQANGLPIPKVYWTKNGLRIQSGDGHRFVSPLGDLSIYHVSLNDQGNYTCTATNIYGSISTHSSIEVIQRSKMATDFKKVKNLIKNVRDNVVLDCDVVYDSRLDREIQLLWKKDDIPIRINRSKYIAVDNSLKIYNLGISDEGTYECQVNTPFESISSKTALIVSGEPPKIVSEFKKIMLYEGEDLKLECLVRGVPRPTLVWHFQDAPLTNAYVHEIATASKVFRESRVIVKNITKANDGVYQCRADNDYGTGVAKFSRVNVLSRTRATISESGEISVHAGTNLKIPCDIEKDQMNQITNIQWVKPFKVGAQDRVDFGVDGSLSIQDVQRRHSGKYKCKVTTILDEASSYVNVTVNVNAPFISSFTGESQFIFQGESLALFCNGNGIPKPTISWNFNKTQTKIINNSEFKILNAIASDSGKYECTARNQYGETRKTILVRVVQVPSLEYEISVDEEESADLPCVSPKGDIRIRWIDPKGQNASEFDTETGILRIENVDQNALGEYTCIISLDNGRSRTLKRNLRIKPEIILSRNNTVVEILEGKNLTLECSVLPGIVAKRLWKHNENIIIPGGNREVSNRGGLLTIENIRRDVDSGKYICMAIADFGKDTIEYTVSVESLVISKKEVSCTESHSSPIFLTNVIRTGNDSVLVRWDYPSLFNASCYEGMILSWWTNEEDGSFSELPVSFSSKKEVLISGLDEDLRYYVQMNLEEKGGDLEDIVGETRSFYLEELSFEDLSLSDSREMPSEALSLLSIPVLLVLVLAFLILSLAAGTLVYLYYKSKLVCCGHNKQKVRKRTNIYNPDFRDFQLIQSPARGIDDFMQNLAPQWPEAEPPTKQLGGSLEDADETAAFIKTTPSQRNASTPLSALPSHHPILPPGHPSQNNSISSSWSSLFNMPIDPAMVRMSSANNKFSGFVT